MIWLTNGRIEIDKFLESGEAEANELIIPMLERNGFSMCNFQKVLDFGCGCGRLMRHWQYVRDVEFWGVDYNRKMVEWCTANLKFAKFKVNRLDPPLPCNQEQFDFIYSRSVFTLMTEALQNAWIQELYRVIKPAGVLFFTVRGDSYSDLMRPDELENYHKGCLVVQDGEYAGRRECAAFHPTSYVQAQWPRYGFDILDFVQAEGGRYAHQDAYLARKAS
jgi:SAM-dependent methyltransferase